MDTAPDINWEILTKAARYYENLGFTRVEVPWLVSEAAVRSTFGGESVPIFKGLHNIGSGEQGFVELMLQGKLPEGKYFTITPCFRDEERETALTRYSFMKLELCVTDMGASMYNVIDSCRTLFETLSGQQTETILVDDTLDIELNGIEIGSYGVRTYMGHRWIYATGLAEPRFSQACSA